MIGNILCIALGYALAQFVSLSKLRSWVATFRKDGVGEADDDWTKPGGSA